jgi:putative ABC transport system substrate-binding protein
VTNSAQSTSIIKELTTTTPIVFANVPDPVAAKIVDTLSRPGGNATGFSSFDVELSGKWLELLRELAPTVRRIGVNYYPVNPMWQPRLALLKAEATKAGVGIETIPTSTPADIRKHFKSFAQGADGAIIVFPSVFTLAYSGELIAAAQDNHLPAIYPYTSFVRRGGLLAYGPDQFDTFSRAAGYVDRILNGASTADLPVQRPTKFELLVNLNSAKALGLTVPPMLLGRADEVIE